MAINLKSPFRKVGLFINRHAMISFIVLLVLLTGLIVLGSFIRKPKETTTDQKAAPKAVHTFSLKDSSSVILHGTVEKAGIVTITAQSSGIVSSVNVHEGDKVRAGQTLVSLSTSYAGGTMQTVSKQIAQKNASFLNDNYNLQKEAIARQRDAAERAYQQGVDMRDIARNSQNDTKTLISANEEMLASVNAQIATLPEGIALEQAKQSRVSLLSALSQLKSALSTSEYQNDPEKAPAKGSNEQKEATFRQLEIQEKQLDLNKGLASLNLRIAQITESLMYPATPFSGNIEKIFVKKGESVSPGDVIAQVTGTNTSASSVLLVTKEIATRISRISETTIKIGTDEVSILPRYISTQPTDGTLYSILYAIPDEKSHDLTDGEALTFEIPLASEESESTDLYVPVDAIYQAPDSSYLFIVEEGEDGTLRASEKTVVLGPVSGSFVQVLSGIDNSVRIITDRNVLASDVVTEK